MPIANLEAAIRDFITPKRKPGEKVEVPDGGFRPHWRGVELLPDYASFGDEVSGETIPPDTLDDLRNNKAFLPLWVLEIIDLSILKG